MREGAKFITVTHNICKDVCRWWATISDVRAASLGNFKQGGLALENSLLVTKNRQVPPTKNRRAPQLVERFLRNENWPDLLMTRLAIYHGLKKWDLLAVVAKS